MSSARMKILHVVGARPNFMKLAPVYFALRQHEVVGQYLIHSGQHYDAGMSSVFFQQLGLPEPDVNLEVGSGSHAMQTAQTMIRLEPHVLRYRPDLTLVYGDVNSTLATALVCAKLVMPVAHVEAGLRSFDRTMPEELNRILTDQLSDLLFTPSEDGNRNLEQEGISRDKIRFVGNTMIDTLIRLLPQATELWSNGLAERFGSGPYALATLHRPSNVDDPATMKRLLEVLDEVAAEIRVIFPIHPRTRQRLEQFGIAPRRMELCEPLGYLEFLALQSRARMIVTDSGGIQEESTYLRVPCLTVRDNTERPVTITVGSNVLVGADAARLLSAMRRILHENPPPKQIPALWDGAAGERIARVILEYGCRTAGSEAVLATD